MRPFFLLFLLLSCQVKQEATQNIKTTSGNIINGTKLSREESDLARAGVALFYGNSSCSGILVSRNVILSAGHCFPSDGLDTSKVKVYLGSESPAAGNKGTQYQVEKVIIHPDYIKTQVDADLAVIVLKDNVSNNYEAMDLYDSNDYLEVADPLVIAGFSPFSKPVRKSVYDVFTEKYRYDYQNTNSENRFPFKKIKNLLSRKAIVMSDKLMGRNTQDAIFMTQLAGGICSGDSGGPTMTQRGDRHYLVGINRAVQFANKLKGSDCEFISISTSVRFYKSWINETVRNNNGLQITWTNPKEEVNQRDKECANTLTLSFDIYYGLANPTPDFCQQLSYIDIAQELKDMNEACEQTCSNLKGFEGQCSFLSRGNADMIKLNQDLCQAL